MAIEPDFYARYDAMLARWPIPSTAIDLPGRFGVTHVNVAGVEGGSPVVLLPGGRSTSAGWYATVGALADTHRLYAVDLLGDAGRSVPGGRRMAGLDDAMTWLAETLDGLGLAAAAFVGHSYGAYLATRFAIHAAQRVTRLALVDPTDCLSRTRLAFLLRGIPLFLGRGPDRFRTFHRWETGGRTVDPDFLDLWAGRFGGPSAGSFAWPRVPTAAESARLTMPILVFAAMASRQNHAATLVKNAQNMHGVRLVTIPDASHFTVPQQHPDEINPPLAEFLRPSPA